VSAPLLLLPFALQGAVMGVDEFRFHQRRVLPRWEWLGHALDTAVFLACLGIPLLRAPDAGSLRLFGGLALLSCLLITKDEWVHQRLCSAAEHWVHALLFVLHPLVLGATAFLWMGPGLEALRGAPPLARAWAWGTLLAQALVVAGFLGVQLLSWRFRRAPAEVGPGINNGIYDELGDRWYTASDDPVALLRAEARLRTSWVLGELAAHFGGRPLAILDVACGGGFLANPLAAAGHAVTGIDLSRDSLAVARRHDPGGTVAYLEMDARSLAFPDGSFDVVCMMDFLEHLAERDAVIREASRVLRPGGWFLFHTFNRNPLSGLIAIKGVEWFVRNTPRHMHVYELFLKPAELRELCARHHLVTEVVLGVQPRVFTRAFLGLLCTGRVSDAFAFRFTRSLVMGYCGRARKVGP
jgi:2-polyprenyl-6-hydroxyphenyl methylase/3-demethylubiquinone-9 3-methyltransferase